VAKERRWRCCRAEEMGLGRLGRARGAAAGHFGLCGSEEIDIGAGGMRSVARSETLDIDPTV
jgi:hypothetical protein